MFKSTIDYIRTHPFVHAVPKCSDPQRGYWVVKCTAVAIRGDVITYRCVCEHWLDYTLNIPVPASLFTLSESVFLTLTQTIVNQRIEYLCTLA